MEHGLLLVDDEANILASLKRALRRENYTIYTAESGETALQLLEQHEISVIVSDQRMPSMNGATFLEKAKAIKPDSIRIMLSGFSEVQSLVDVINHGMAWRFIFKPWEDEYLRMHIQEAFRVYESTATNRLLQDQLQEASEAMSKLNDLLYNHFESMQRSTVEELNQYRKRWHELPCLALEINREGAILALNKPSSNLNIDEIILPHLDPQIKWQSGQHATLGTYYLNWVTDIKAIVLLPQLDIQT